MINIRAQLETEINTNPIVQAVHEMTIDRNDEEFSLWLIKELINENKRLQKNL